MNIATASVDLELHCVYLDDHGSVWHCIRFQKGHWQKWSQLPSEGFVSISAAGVGRDFHVVAVTAKNEVFHNIRKEGGKWQGFAKLEHQPSAPNVP